MCRLENSPILLTNVDDFKYQIQLNNENKQILKFYKILLLFQITLIMLFYNYYLRLS
jgi:hypothetical protein